MADSARTTIALGVDPAEDQALLRSTPIFSQFITEQYLPYFQIYKLSWKCDLSTLRVHLLPVLGNKELDIIKRTDIFAFQQRWIHVGKAPGTINKHLVLLRYIFNLALMQVDNKCQRFFTGDEAQSILNAVRNSKNIVLEPIVSMLIITGARKRGVLYAR